MSKANPTMPTEAQEQVAFFQWAAIASRQHKELAGMHAIPNGGSRDVREAVHMKRQGVRAGVADIFLPCARGGHHGLYVEMKRRDGGVRSKPQEEFAAIVTSEGYKHVFAAGCAEAIAAVTAYLES